MNDNQKIVLIIEDGEIARENWTMQLKEAGFEVIAFDRLGMWEASKESIDYEQVAGAILDYCIIGGNTSEIAVYLSNKGIRFIGASADIAFNRELVKKGALLMSTKENAVESLLRTLASSASEIEEERNIILAEIQSIDKKIQEFELLKAERENTLELAYDQDCSPNFRINVPNGLYEVACVSLYQLCEFAQVAWHLPLKGIVEVMDQKFVTIDGARFKITGTRTGLNGSCKVINIWINRYIRGRRDYCTASLYLNVPSSENERDRMEEEVASKYELWENERGIKEPLPLSKIFEIIH